MTVTDRIFQNVAELSVPNFSITVEFSVMGNEMPEHIESFVLEKYQAILQLYFLFHLLPRMCPHFLHNHHHSMIY